MGHEPDEERMLTVAEVARWLSVSSQTVLRLVRTDEIPHLRLSDRVIRFDRTQLQQWADQRAGGTDSGPRVPEPE